MGIEDTYLYGLDNRPLTHRLCTCAHCGHEQYERPHNDPNDKFAWICRNCHNVTEEGGRHLLHQSGAYFPDPCVVCKGFGYTGTRYNPNFEKKTHAE